MQNNPRNQYFIFLLFLGLGLALGFGLSALPKRASAATQKYTGSSDPSQVRPLIIPTDLALKWKGHYTIEDGSVLERQHRGLRDAITYSLTGQYTGGVKPNELFSFNPASVYQWIVANTKSYNIQPHEPKITIDGNRVTEFEPPQNGQTVDAFASMEQGLINLERGDYNVTPVVNVTQSRNNLGELNDLGIKELISRGESSFSGSPSNRRHNIKVGVQKMTGIIVKPGEEFSFNKYLGAVEASTGFLPELVIKGGEGTVPEFGGGLCQVSTTTFRAAMHAGLPITARRNHSYAVQYYAPQGTDATIYPGSADLKFINDTPGSIMIWPYIPDANTLVFDFYGTRDDRQVTLKDPVQFGRKSDGSMKASWTRIVTKDGKTETKTFASVYQPPALFHKTEKFVPAGGTPDATTPTTNSPVTTTPELPPTATATAPLISQ